MHCLQDRAAKEEKFFECGKHSTRLLSPGGCGPDETEEPRILRTSLHSIHDQSKWSETPRNPGNFPFWPRQFKIAVRDAVPDDQCGHHGDTDTSGSRSCATRTVKVGYRVVVGGGLAARPFMARGRQLRSEGRHTRLSGSRCDARLKRARPARNNPQGTREICVE